MGTISVGFFFCGTNFRNMFALTAENIINNQDDIL